MEQFFGLVNTFLQNHRDTWKRKLGIRTYKVSSSVAHHISFIGLNQLASRLLLWFDYSAHWDVQFMFYLLFPFSHHMPSWSCACFVSCQGIFMLVIYMLVVFADSLYNAICCWNGFSIFIIIIWTFYDQWDCQRTLPFHQNSKVVLRIVSYNFIV